jgi:hypothetical protein
MAVAAVLAPPLQIPQGFAPAVQEPAPQCNLSALFKERCYWSRKGFRLPPIQESLQELEAFFKLAKGVVGSYDVLLRRLSTENSFEALLKILVELSPIAAKAWEIACREEKLTIEEVSSGSFVGTGNKKLFHSKAGSMYLSFTHKIKLNKDAEPVHKLRSLIFEIMNAVQRKAILTIIERVQKGKLSREEYVFMLESIEYNSHHWRYRICVELGLPNDANPCYSNFDVYWLKANTIKEGCEQSHAGNYRTRWDDLYAKIFGAL